MEVKDELMKVSKGAYDGCSKIDKFRGIIMLSTVLENVKFISGPMKLYLRLNLNRGSIPLPPPHPKDCALSLLPF